MMTCMCASFYDTAVIKMQINIHAKRDETTQRKKIAATLWFSDELFSVNRTNKGFSCPLCRLTQNTQERGAFGFYAP